MIVLRVCLLMLKATYQRHLIYKKITFTSQPIRYKNLPQPVFTDFCIIVHSILSPLMQSHTTGFPFSPCGVSLWFIVSVFLWLSSLFSFIWTVWFTEYDSCTRKLSWGCVCCVEAKLCHHDEWEDHTPVWNGERAGEEGLGGPLPGFHGGEGHTCTQPTCCRQEAPGPVPPLPVCAGHRRPGHGEWRKPVYVIDLKIRIWAWI